MNMAGSLFYKIFPVFARRGKTDLSIPLSFSLNDDAIDQLRSEVLDRVLQQSPEKKSFILGVTSCEYGEGAYQTALRLAHSFTQIREHVLLIDLDFRSAQISRAVFSSKPESSLNDVLASENTVLMLETVSAAVCSFENTSLEVLPAVKVAGNPSGLLEAVFDSALLEKLSEYYDVIVCALPPAGIYADASMATRDIDGIIFTVRENYTKREMIDNVFTQSRILKEKALGFMYYSAV